MKLDIYVDFISAGEANAIVNAIYEYLEISDAKYDFIGGDLSVTVEYDTSVGENDGEIVLYDTISKKFPLFFFQTSNNEVIKNGKCEKLPEIEKRISEHS